MNSEHPGGGVHGEDQDADHHGFHSRHGPASPSSSPLPVLCLGMLWRTELAGCAQRDSAEPVKQSGVREGQMPPVSAFFIPASTFVSRPEHGIEAAVAFSHQRPTTRSEPSALDRDTGRCRRLWVVAGKTGVKSLDNRN